MGERGKVPEVTMKMFSKESPVSRREANRQGANESLGRLAEAVKARRAVSGPTRLSDDARAAIVQSVQRSSEPAPELFPGLFKAPRRLVTAGVLPLVLAAALLVVLERPEMVEAPAVATSESSATTRIQAYKDGDQVFFEIANGGTPHAISRSTDPVNFDSESRVPVIGGSYTENLDDQADLVFYRID